MKILMVSDSFPPDVKGGAEKFCLELVLRLKAKGNSVAVATSSIYQSYLGLNLFNLYKFKNKYARKFLFDYYNFIALAQFKKILAEFKPDLVHFHNIYGISSKLIAYSTTTCPTMVTAHDFWPFCFHSTMLQNKGTVCDMDCRYCTFPLGWLTRNIKKNHLLNAHLVAPSGFMADKLRQAGFRKVSVIHNGIELPKQKSKGGSGILYMGRISNEKGIYQISDMLHDLGSECYIVGDGLLLSKLKAKAQKMSNLHIVGRTTDVGKFYMTADLALVPSIWPENFPYSVLEAMSYGVPVVAYSVGGIPELVQDGKTGVLVEPGNVKQLNAKLELLLSDKKLRVRMGLAGRARARSEFSWKKTVDAYTKLYGDLIKKAHK